VRHGNACGKDGCREFFVMGDWGGKDGIGGGRIVCIRYIAWNGMDCISFGFYTYTWNVLIFRYGSSEPRILFRSFD
jgi:hypothetical protein